MVAWLGVLRFFYYTVGWLGGCIVGRGEVVGVWVVAECRSGDGRVKKLVV